MNILADEQLKMMEAGLTKEEYARRREVVPLHHKSRVCVFVLLADGMQYHVYSLI